MEIVICDFDLISASISFSLESKKFSPSYFRTLQTTEESKSHQNPNNALVMASDATRMVSWDMWV
jgi:hypothetical protein